MRFLIPLILLATAAAQVDDNLQFPAFRIIGNVYYVGTNEIGCYLITTRKGHILINSGYPNTPALIMNSVEQLGFHMPDIVYLLSSHARLSGVGGLSTIQEMSGGRVWASSADGRAILLGGDWNGEDGYLPVDVNRFVQDGSKLELGGTTLVAHITPGCSKGSTTWTLEVKEDGKTYEVAILGGGMVRPGTALKGNPRYPNIAVDYLRTFQTLRSLKCDVFLSAFGSDFGLKEKYKRLKQKPAVNPFIDSEGYRSFVDRAEKVFHFYLGS